jgi:hypothetical protein
MQHFCFALAFLLGIKMFAYCTGTRCLKNVCSFYYRYLAGTRPGKVGTTLKSRFHHPA